MIQIKHDIKPQVAIIGAGILGASLAFQLSRRGANVSVIDAGQVGDQATQISFAWLNAYNKEPLAYHHLNRRSMDMWPRFIDSLMQFQDDTLIDLTWGGELRWSNTEAGAETLKARSRRNLSLGYPTRMITSQEAMDLEPRVNFGQCLAASYSDCDGHVDALQATRACAVAAKRLGAHFYLNSPVTSIDLGKGKVSRVWMKNAHVDCDHLIIACGADTPIVASLLGLDIPVRHTFGATILTEPIAKIFNHIAVLDSPRDGNAIVNIRQFKDGTVMLQGYDPANTQSEFDGDRGKTDEEIRRIMQDASSIIPALSKANIKTVQRGRRPIPKDGLPIIGFSEQVPNAYVLTTHSGVTLTPILSEMASLEIIERIEIEQLSAFRPNRFFKV